MSASERFWLAPLLIASCGTPAPERAPPATGAIVPAPEPVAVPTPAAPPAAVSPEPSATVTASGLRIEELKVGSGALAGAGTRVLLHYVGALEDGTVFDSRRERGTPIELELGRGHLIKGFEEGLSGMREGGLRRLTIPPDLGYGARAHQKIPPNSTLSFEIEVIEVRTP